MLKVFSVHKTLNVCCSARRKRKFIESKIDKASGFTVSRIDTEINTTVDSNQKLVAGGPS